MIERPRYEQDRTRAEAYDALAHPVAPEVDDGEERVIRTPADENDAPEGAPRSDETLSPDLEGLEVDEPDPSVEEALHES